MLIFSDYVGHCVIGNINHLSIKGKKKECLELEALRAFDFSFVFRCLGTQKKKSITKIHHVYIFLFFLLLFAALTILDHSASLLITNQKQKMENVAGHLICAASEVLVP